MKILELKPITKIKGQWAVVYRRKSRRGTTISHDLFPNLSEAQRIWWRFWSLIKLQKINK